MAATTKVRQKEPGQGGRRSRAASQARLHARYKDHVWNCAFVEAQTPDSEPFEVLAILDAYTLECLSISVERQISLDNIVDRLFDLLVLREIPKHIVLGSGSESLSKAVAEWLSHLPVETKVADPDSGWEEDGAWLLGTRLRDEVLANPAFGSLPEARTLLADWQGRYNETRPQHSPLEDEPQVPLSCDTVYSPEAEAALTQTLQPRPGSANLARPAPKSPANAERCDGRQARVPTWVWKTAKVAEYVGIVLVVLLMTMVVLALLAPHYGWRADTVLSGSMEPALPVGCVQVTRPVKPQNIEAGDIITFRSPFNGKLMSHRVVAVEESNSYQFRTKGDANEDADPYLIPSENVVGKVCLKVAGIGYVIEYLKSPIGFILLGLVGVALIVAEISTMLEIRWKESAQANPEAKQE